MGEVAADALFRQIADHDLVTLAGGQGEAQGVVQLADIAWPGIGEQSGHGVPAQPSPCIASLGPKFLEQSTHQVALIGPLAQRRQAQAGPVQAVEQVLAELAQVDQPAQVAMGGRHHAQVDLDRSAGTDRQHLPLGQHAQQPGLQLQRHVADLVEEERAAVGLGD